MATRTITHYMMKSLVDLDMMSALVIMAAPYLVKKNNIVSEPLDGTDAESPCSTIFLSFAFFNPSKTDPYNNWIDLFTTNYYYEERCLVTEWPHIGMTEVYPVASQTDKQFNEYVDMILMAFPGYKDDSEKIEKPTFYKDPIEIEADVNGFNGVSLLDSVSEWKMCSEDYVVMFSEVPYKQKKRIDTGSFDFRAWKFVSACNTNGLLKVLVLNQYLEERASILDKDGRHVEYVTVARFQEWSYDLAACWATHMKDSSPFRMTVRKMAREAPVIDLTYVETDSEYEDVNDAKRERKEKE